MTTNRYTALSWLSRASSTGYIIQLNEPYASVATLCKLLGITKGVLQSVCVGAGVRRIRGILHQGGDEADFFHVGDAQRAYKEHTSSVSVSDDMEWVTSGSERYGTISAIAQELGVTEYSVQTVIDRRKNQIPVVKKGKKQWYWLSTVESLLSTDQFIFDKDNFLVREDGKYGTVGGIADYFKVGAAKLRLRITEAVVRTIEAKSAQWQKCTLYHVDDVCKACADILRYPASHAAAWSRERTEGAAV